MNGVAVEVIIILLLILVNGVLSMAEIAVVSSRRARLHQRSDEGDEKARAALDLANQPTNFFSTVQVGITLIGILTGAFGGATIAEELSIWLAGYPALAPYSEAIGVIVVVLVITYFSLILGELVPKRLALNNPERIASSLANPMRFISRLFSPVVRFLSFSTELVLRLLRASPTDDLPVTEDEIRVMIDLGTKAGVFAEEEQDMVEAIFRLGDRRVGTLMVPRTEVTWLDLEDPLEVTQRKIIGSPYSRLPVARGSLDDVVGIVQAKDLLSESLAGKPLNLTGILHQPIFVPDSMPAFHVLELLRTSSVQMALVIDEFGGFQGLVSLFDILESIVGEIPETGELIEREVVQREDGSWLIDGMLPIDEFKEIFRLNELPGEERGYYQTVGGFVLSYLGHIPKSSDHFHWSGLRFEVVDMDGMRIDKIMVMPSESSENGST